MYYARNNLKINLNIVLIQFFEALSKMPIQNALTIDPSTNSSYSLLLYFKEFVYACLYMCVCVVCNVRTFCKRDLCQLFSNDYSTIPYPIDRWPSTFQTPQRQLCVDSHTSCTSIITEPHLIHNKYLFISYSKFINMFFFI